VSATPNAEAVSVVKLEEALTALQCEAVIAPSRELSLSITKAEEALMWRQRISPPPRSEPAQAPETAPPP